MQRKHPAHCPPIERFNSPIIIFLTVCTRNRLPCLASEQAHQLLLSAWQLADSWVVGRYVIMPDHIHLFCSPRNNLFALDRWIAYWKGLTSKAWPDRTSTPLWQKDFWDTQLRHERHYDTQWDYVVKNPVRAGLVARAEQWPFAGELNRLTL